MIESLADRRESAQSAVGLHSLEIWKASAPRSSGRCSIVWVDAVGVELLNDVNFRADRKIFRRPRVGGCGAAVEFVADFRRIRNQIQTAVTRLSARAVRMVDEPYNVAELSAHYWRGHPGI